MHKKKEYSPVKISQSQANDLAFLIARMQKNADQVEKNVLSAEQLLEKDSENRKRNLTFRYQGENSDNLAEAEGLLKELFLDVDRVKKLQHPQANDIEVDVINLHDRWSKDCGTYRDLYEQVNELDSAPRVDWAQLLREKQNQISKDVYGPNLSDVEKQIAAHNIQHKEIEAYSPQLQQGSPSSLDEQRQYARLLESSQLRSKHLASLYDYLQGCTKEMVYLSERQDKILARDWSDRMVDAPGVRMEYERFKNNGLMQHETDVNQLQEEAQGLVKMKHPAGSTIKAHNDAVQNEWQSFLNLCLCQDTHLDNVEDYKKYQLDVETLSESLKRINSTMDPKLLQKMSNPEIVLQLEGEERAIQRNEQRLADLKEFCTTIAPLPQRRTGPSRGTPAITLCDWSTDKATMRRGDKFTLVSHPSEENWEVKSSTGETKVFPGACFLIPPPDSDAIDKVESLARELAELKRRRATLQASARTPTVEVVQAVKTATVASAPENPKAAILDGRLDKLNADLVKTEKDVLNRLRAPLDRPDPTGDLSSRLRDHEKSVLTLRNLEAEKAAIQREMEPLLSPKPLGPTTTCLPLKLSTATNKIDDISNLSNQYNKKATAAMFLENQIKNVDKMLSRFERQLAADTVVPDDPDALRDHQQELKTMQKDLASEKNEMQKLSRDFELTEQLCSTIQKSFQEFCPDIRQQEAEVKHLRNRYTNVNNQLQERTALMQEAVNKNQSFQSTVQTLNAFLINMPNNKIKPTDNLSQINAKQNSQRRVVDDIKRKSDDVERVVSLSRDLQNVVNEYETNSEKYRTSLDIDEPDAKKLNSFDLADDVQEKERDIVNLYAEVSAENNQLLNQLGVTKNMISKNEELTSQVVVKQQQHLQSQQRDLQETGNLKRDLSEEIARRSKAEADLEIFRRRMLSLRSRRGVERLEEKEIVQYYRDPKLEADVLALKKRIQEEIQKRSITHTEIEVVNQKIVQVEHEITNIKPQLVTKVFTEFERDPQLDKDAEKMREEMRKLRDEVSVRESETVHMRTEITVLSQKRPTIKEKVVKKEVVKLEKDPEMLKAVITFKNEISDEGIRCKNLNDDIFHIRSQINTLERIIPTVQPKIIIKEIKKVEQDPELIKESKNLHSSIEEEMRVHSSLIKELTSLQLRYGEVAKLKPKVETKEIINEIYRVDPDTEAELLRLKRDLQESSHQRTSLEYETNTLLVELNSLRSQKPKVELKEVTQELIKEERSPETMRELKRLYEQLTRVQTTYDSTLDRLNHMRKERDEWKVEKSKVETKLVTKDVIKYENDPLLEKEADRLRRDVREEIQQRRSVEETVFDMQNQYILLERQKPEEKVVVQEVLRLEKDPRQILDHEKLNKSLDEEIKSRRKLELEVQQLRALVLELERNLSKMDDRQKKILVETELRQVKSRLYELENAPPPIEEKIVIEEVLKVERDPKLEKLTNDLRTDMENESTTISNLERNIRNLKIRIDILHKEKSVEKTVYKEVIRVEKDQTVEAERARLRDEVTREKNARRDQEDELERLNSKLTRFQTMKTSTTHDETTLTLNRDALQRERDNFLRELNRMEVEKQNISITFQNQSKLMSERNQINRQRSIKMESDIQRLEKEILNEKDNIYKRENKIMELQNSLKKEDHAETQTRETNLSTKITILDPETGKDMSPYDAYVEGLIDRNQYIQLQELECNWEEITTTGPEGETTVLQDRKSGKQYSIKNALKEGRLTQYDVQRYKDGQMPISEFALLVAGEKKPKPFIGSLRTPSSPVKSSPFSYQSYSSPSSTRLPSYSNSSSVVSINTDETFPISGVLDMTTGSRMSVRSAMTRKLIDHDTALKLLEAQAATGGIVDLNKKDRLSVHKAAEQGLIDTSQMHTLLNAQKAFTGVEDPVTKERLSTGEAAEKGWIPNDTAMRYMEAQYLTGGLVNPKLVGRISIPKAIDTKMIDDFVAKELQDESTYAKDLIDPITREKMSYKEAMERCKTDKSTGVLLLPVASTDSVDAPSYSSYRFSSSHSRV